MENGQFQRLVEEIQESRRHTDEVAAQLRQTEVQLRQHTAELVGEVRQEVASLRGHNGQEMASLREHSEQSLTSLRENAEQNLASLRAEIRGSVVEMKRYFDVVAEDLRASDQLLAEGIATVDAKVDRLGGDLRGEMRAEFAETRAMIKLSYRELDRRITTLEESA